MSRKRARVQQIKPPTICYMHWELFFAVLAPIGGCPGNSLSKCMEMSKLGNHLEGSRQTIDGFSSLVDQFRTSVTEESRSLAKVNDSDGFESHQTRTSCVGSHRIVREHNLPQRTRRSIKGPVSFHCHNAVRDHKVDRNSCA